MLSQQPPENWPEWIKYLLATLLLPAAAAAWRFIIGPFWQWFSHSSEDEREFRQTEEMAQANFERLQISWQQERLSTILEENESFIRERVWAQLDKIDRAIEDRLYKVELSINQFKAVLDVHARNIYELEKRQRAIETKLGLLIEMLMDGKIKTNDEGD